MRRLVPWALLALSLSANAAIAAIELRHRLPASPGEPLVFSRVEVDPGQRSRILELRSQLVASRAEHARRLAVLRAELADAVVQEPRDHAEVESILGRISKEQAELQREIVGHVLAVRDVLRTDQRPQFEEIMVKRVREGGPLPCEESR